MYVRIFRRLSISCPGREYQVESWGVKTPFS